MPELDYNYIASVFEHARSGNSDAFAELYAATYQKQYLFSYCYMNDEFLAQDALQETYILALRNINTLKDPKLFVSWLNQINFRVCYNMSLKQSAHNSDDGFSFIHNSPDEHFRSADSQTVIIDGQEYFFQEILALPLSESQVIFLHYCKEIGLKEIAYMMDLRLTNVTTFLESGKRHLSASAAIVRNR